MFLSSTGNTVKGNGHSRALDPEERWYEHAWVMKLIKRDQPDLDYYVGEPLSRWPRNEVEPQAGRARSEDGERI